MSYVDPTLGLTFDEICLRVAEYLGVAPISGGVPVIPSNTEDIARVRRAVNDGYRRLVGIRPWQSLRRRVAIRVAPPLATGSATGVTATTLADSARTEGAGAFPAGSFLRILSGSGREMAYPITNWNHVTKEFTIAGWGIQPSPGDSYQITTRDCAYGEAWRYFMPSDFTGTADSTWTLAPSDNTYTSIAVVSEDRIRAMREAMKTSSNVPSMIAFSALSPPNPSGSGGFSSPPLTGRRWEMLIWPDPSSPMIIEGRYTAHPYAMTSGTDRHILGPAYDELLIACSLAEAERQFMDGGDGRCERYFQEALAITLRRDAQTASRRIGYMQEPSDEMIGNHRPHGGVSTYNGVPV